MGEGKREEKQEKKRNGKEREEGGRKWVCRSIKRIEKEKKI